MFNKYVVIILIVFSFTYAQTYCAGDQVSTSHQNEVHLVGAGTDEFEVGGDFRLADWNGDLNGGSYSVIFIDMSASW